MSITETSIKRPLLITVIFVILILFGFIGYNKLSVNLLPKFTVNSINVSTTYTGASPEEVQTSITKPLEDALSSVEGVDLITSTSQEGLSSISIELISSVQPSDAQLDAERKIDQILSTLPEEADAPVVSRMNSDDSPILKVSINANLNETALYDFVDNEVKPMLTNIPGVADVNVIGGVERQVNIQIDNDKLRAYNISILDINKAISTSGASFPAGKIDNSTSRFSLDLNAKVKNVAEINGIVLKQSENGSRVLLSDVASIIDSKETITTINRLNGQPAIGIELKKQSDANSVEVNTLAKARLEELKTSFASNGFSYTIASDQSVYTQASVDAVVYDLFLAIIIVGLVMLFFLHSFRSSSFVLVALPSAMIPTFILMWLFGFSINLMTLLALSLVVGILVDDSIVVLENIYRHLEMGKDKRTAALEGRAEISYTAVAITLVDVVVFLPLGLVDGMIGSIVREYALVVAFSTLMSLLVAFTLTPLLASRWGKLAILKPETLWGKMNLQFEAIIDSIREFYTSVLKWSLRHKIIMISFISALLIGSIALIPGGFIGSEFIPESDRGELNIQVDLAANTSLKETNATVQQLEEMILQYPEVDNVFSNVGTQSGQMGSGGSSTSNLAEISVTLKDSDQRSISTAEFSKNIREEILKVPGVKPTIKLVGLTGNSSFDVQMSVQGTNRDSITKAAAIVKEVMTKTAGTDYVQYSSKDSKPQISIVLDREKISTYGLEISDVGSAIQFSFNGNDTYKFKEEGEEYAINFQLDPASAQTINDVKNLNLINKNGSNIPLSAVADISETVSQPILERYNRLYSMQVNAVASGLPAGTVMEAVKAELKNKKLPEGVSLVEAGMSKNQGDAFASLFMAIILGVVLIYLIMVALYESVIYPFIVLFSIPVALIGALLALALTMKTLNIFSLLGVILLLGLVAKNGILIVDFANSEKEKGLSVKDALISAGRERLRPILMTTLAMVFGMLPLALSTSAGSETKSAVAWVVIGGLISSMIFTLLIVPIMYTIIEKLRVKFNKLFSEKS